jgi:hypothetical protein
VSTNIINLDDVLTVQKVLTYKGKEYTFKFSDGMDKAVQDAWVQANAYAKKLLADDPENKMDEKPVEEQRAYVRDALNKQHEIVMGFFVETIGADQAKQLYDDLNQSTDGLMFILGLVKRLADQSIKDARDAEYPQFDGNQDA